MFLFSPLKCDLATTQKSSLTVSSLLTCAQISFIAKGRTNVELREQFTLASGVSQSMTPFKSRPAAGGSSPGSSVAGGSQRPSISGPITKVP
jgi:hypothetical protein